MSRRALALFFALALVLAQLVAAAPAQASNGAAAAVCRTYPSTGRQVCDRFLEYWDTNGGLAQQGYPLTDAFIEVSPTDGKPYLTQYFERARFEYHPGNIPPFDVLLGLLGDEQLKAKYPNGAPPGLSGNPIGATCMTFQETGKQVCGLFLDYWRANGGLAQQGLPLTDLFLETNPTDGKPYPTQYFERARFEYHVENQGTPYVVLLGLLGREQLPLRRPTNCVGFESLPQGTSYSVGNVFTDGGMSMLVRPFTYANGGTTSGGFTKVENGGKAGGSGQELQVNNVNLEFGFAGPIPGIRLRFGEYGGNLNLTVNGSFVNFANFASIGGTTIGGVAVVVTGGAGTNMGTLTLNGPVNSFSIGGQELWIDDICPLTSCMSFEGLTLNTSYVVGATFSAGVANVTVQPFTFANGGTATNGFTRVENGGKAGGNGQELQINNVNLDFAFGSPISGIRLRFGEYGGNLNLEVNGSFVNFANFIDINNKTIGGVVVSVSGGLGNDQGSVVLTGPISSLSIGGQELWLDDGCR